MDCGTEKYIGAIVMTTAKMDIPPIIAACVAKEATRFARTHVWVQDGYQVGSDRRIVARRPFSGPGPEGLREWPTVSFGADLYESEPTRIPTVTKVACAACGQTGTQACAECDGYIEIECSECGHEYDCRECDGTGKEDCDKCGGTIFTYEPHPVIITPGVGMAGRYAFILQEHGAALYLPKDDKGRAGFRFTVPPNIEGLLMPYRVGNYGE